MTLPFTLDCTPPWLLVRFPGPRRLLGWPLNQGGFGVSDRLAWRAVRNDELGPEIDPDRFLAERLDAAGLAGVPCLLTARDVRFHHLAEAVVEDRVVTVLTTLGLGNAGRVGARHDPAHPPAGTINTLIHTSCPLTDGAMVETIAIAASACTLALLEAGIPTPDGPATGTGTDCLVVAAPSEGPAERHAGLHTALGEAVGKAVLGAMRAAIPRWQTDRASWS